METNMMAIISLVFGILGLTGCPGLGSLIALFTSGLAKNEIRNSGGTQSGEALAQWGAILGWVGLGLFGLGLCLAVVLVFVSAWFGYATDRSWLPPLIFVG